MRHRTLAAALAAMGSIGMAQTVERIHDYELPRHIDNRGITVTTIDGVKHSGRQLLLQPDHLRVFRKDDDWEDLQCDEVARIEIRQRGRFLAYAEMAFFFPLILPAAECEDSHHPVICWTISSVAFSPMWVTVSAIPFLLAAEGVTRFIPARVYEIVH